MQTVVPEAPVRAPQGLLTGKAAHRRRPSRSRSFPVLLAAFGVYLVLSILLWWQVWSSHPAGVTSCGCGDASLFLWYLEWPAYALTHGHGLLYSGAMFHPTGTNLLSNTSVLVFGIPLIPITLLFGPVATLNVAATLAPAFTALAMFWLLRRWVRWTPAAFVGGLLYGFSPFVFVDVAGGHLMLAALFFLPLIAGCLDELLIRQHRNPYAVGAVLGVLVAAQLFTGTEVLAIAAIAAVIGIALLAIYGVLGDRAQLVVRAPYALRGIAVAAGVGLVLLAYPLWMIFAGPAHLSGLIWPSLHPSQGAASFQSMWDPNGRIELRGVWAGYFGPPLPQPDYLGLGVLAVAAAGILAWRHDRRLWFFGTLGVITAFLSMAFAFPWSLFARIPLLQNIVPSRFAAVTTLCAAVVLGVIVDRTHDAAISHRRGRTVPRRTAVRQPPWLGAAFPTGLAAALAALAVAGLALGPVMAAEAANVPFTTKTVVLPRWFARAAPHLPPRQVVLTYPPPFALVQSGMAWQAVERMPFDMAGGGGPGGALERAGKERKGFKVIAQFSYSFVGPPPATNANVTAVRNALAGWGVTMVVVPDPQTVPSYDRGTDVPGALAFYTAAIGRAPRYQDDAWVWTRVDKPSAQLSVTQSGFQRCTAINPESPPRNAISNCLIAAASTTAS